MELITAKVLQVSKLTTVQLVFVLRKGGRDFCLENNYARFVSFMGTAATTSKSKYNLPEMYFH